MSLSSENAVTRPPVLIVGAGLAGASAAVFLGLHGVPALVVSRHPGTANQPKARGQSWHTMEALRIAGVSERIRAAGYDVTLGMPIVVAESLTGPPIHEILGAAWPDLSHITPEHMGMASQEHAEPILLERARELGADVRFHTRLERFAQDEHGVSATLRDLTTGESHETRATHLVGADGGRSGIREALGIATHGRGTFQHTVTTVFDADLADATDGREFTLYYLQNPKLSGGSGFFVSTDTPGRFVVGFGYEPADGERFEDFTDAHCVEQIRIATGIDDLEIRLIDRAPTEMTHQVADRLSADRVHLIGDAAHVMPPHGGQGGNTAVMDGFYLAWKLAAVLHGWAGSGLLDSHDTERRPYGAMVAGQQVTNMIHRSAPHLADGTEDDLLPPEQQLLGYRYPYGAVVTEQDDDGATLEDPSRPTGRPGSHAPHVWLTRDGVTFPVLDLLGHGFVLLTASREWDRAARRVATRLGVPLYAELVDGTDPAEPHGSWTEAYGVGPHGASLIRPDRFVAWRAVDAGTEEELERALRTVLCR